MRWLTSLRLLVGITLVSVVAQAADGDFVASCGEATIQRGQIEAVIGRLGLAPLPAGEQRQRAEASILEQLIDQQILLGELERMGIQVGNAEIEAAVSRLQEQVGGRGMDLQTFLDKSGSTVEEVRNQVTLEIALEKFVHSQITPEAIATVFEKNRRLLDGTRLRVSHIVLRPEAGGEVDLSAGLLEQAAELRRQIIQGNLSFADAARLHSAGASRRRGGDLGWITREGPMVEVFSSRVFELAKGKISPPFVTPYGVHLATVTAIEPGRIGIDAVRPRIEKILGEQLVRALVIAGRQRTPVVFAAGVPHFDPATVGGSAEERQVVVDAGRED